MYNDYLIYKKQSNKTKKLVRKAQADFEKKLMKNFKGKPKAFYGYVRSKQKVKTFEFRILKTKMVAPPRTIRIQQTC